MKEEWTAAELYDLLRGRFTAPAWALLPQVSNATGAGQRRRADAVAMSLWPSRGLEIHGIEIKVSRGDWLRELKDPAKAEEIAGYCDRWWVLAPDGVIKVGELPPTWGRLKPGRKTVDIEVEAPANPATRSLDREFLAALLRAVYDHATPEAEFKRVREAARGEAWKEADEFYKERNERTVEEHKRLAGEHSKLQRALSPSGHSYPKPEEIGRAVEIIRDLSNRFGSLNKLKAAAADVSRAADDIESIAKSIGIERFVPPPIKVEEEGEEDVQ